MLCTELTTFQSQFLLHHHQPQKLFAQYFHEFPFAEHQQKAHGEREQTGEDFVHKL
jgi:hypothetical protein